MDWLLNLIPGGGLTAIIGGVLAVIAAGWAAARGLTKAGENKQKAKEAKARAENLDRIQRAADARPVGSVSDDPNNRDKR